MIPVTQTKRGGPDVPPEERGDCVDACLASILEVPISECPCPHDGDWWEQMQAAVGQHGYRVVYLGGLPEDDSAEALEAWIGAVYWIAAVQSLSLGSNADGSPVMHVVVMRGGEIVHDPSLGKRYPLGPVGAGVVREALLLVPLEIRSAQAVAA